MAVTLAPRLTSLSDEPIDGTTCRHCGDRLGRDAYRSQSGAFCCAGCEAVYSLLASRDLTGFYACDVNAGQSQREATHRDRDRFCALDDPSVAARFVTPAGNGIVRVSFTVPTIHCASCVWLLERLWKFEAGIGRSEVDLLTRTVRVDFDPGRITIRSIAERLSSLGYEPVLDPERRSEVPAARRALYLKIGVAGFAFGNVMLFSIPRYLNGAPLEPAFQRLFDLLNLAFTLPVLVYSASDFFRGAWSAARGRQITLDVPIALGLLVLFGRSVADITQSVGPGFLDSFAGLVFFLLIGRLFQQRAFERIAFDRSTRSFLPLSAYVETDAGATLTPIERLAVGDRIRLRPNEIVPADAVLLDGDAWVNNAFVTGEQEPVPLRSGERAMAGSRVVRCAARFRVERPVSHARLADLWANPASGRPKVHRLQQQSAQFAFWFTGGAIALAAAGAVAWWPDARTSADVATAVLIIACPCAFTLAAPIAVGTAMGILGRAGLYVKHAAVAMDLSRIDTIVFDKTGTLTIAPVETDTIEAPDPAVWPLVQGLAAHSVHPLSRALAGSSVPHASVEGVREVPGQGIRGVVNGRAVCLGSAAFVSKETRHDIVGDDASTWFSVDGGRPHPVRLPTVVRPGIERCLTALSGRFSTWLLSGDRPQVHTSFWRTRFGDRARFQQTPEEKLGAVAALERQGHRVLMLGDGLNDAGALAAASVGIAVSDDTACLVPACDAVLDGARVRQLPELLAYARRVPRVIALSFGVSIVYNVAGIGLALTGALTPLVTAILMPVSSLTIVALSTGLLRVDVPEGQP